jgi:hypothetical protein
MATNNDILAALNTLTEAVLLLASGQTVAAQPVEVTAPANTRAKKAPEGKVFRSAKGKEAAKVEVAALWSDAKIMAGVTRVKDLTPAQRATVDAQVKAVWAAVPKTRSTKA